MRAHPHPEARGRRKGEQALYVYGFTRAGAVERFSVPGVSGAADVRTLKLGNLAAIYSPLSMEEFLGPEGADHTQDLEWVAPRAVRHERVLEEVMRSSPVLPVSFGAIFSSPRALSEAVDAHRQEISRFLDDISDKEEWAVKVYANAQRLRAHLERAPEFRQRLQHLPETPGARYFHEKKLQRELDQRSRNEGQSLAAHIREELAPGAVSVKPLRLADRGLSGRQDDMVLNSAFLVDSGQVQRFTHRVQQLAARYQPRGLTVEATGPWPPYSFCPSLEERP
ncbi:GvpL/GvpF family gas vesicle protein [Myxococcus stipitatus]|uniref:GvpL/GvpF family gas vesicle protein n=1 Tax=Myxococcus stipitatus TaxID=83455 RepID=UPI001F35C14B|nr:GvpL/GvpF family gas vesicle protein [Myxococcus stipitatus]MCE9670114.1 GvpL/GvpF family gas vesicle protein [Myxococcus stipitatus]